MKTFLFFVLFLSFSNLWAKEVQCRYVQYASYCLYCPTLGMHTNPLDLGPSEETYCSECKALHRVFCDDENSSLKKVGYLNGEQTSVSSVQFRVTNCLTGAQIIPDVTATPESHREIFADGTTLEKIRTSVRRWYRTRAGGISHSCGKVLNFQTEDSTQLYATPHGNHSLGTLANATRPSQEICHYTSWPTTFRYNLNSNNSTNCEKCNLKPMCMGNVICHSRYGEMRTQVLCSAPNIIGDVGTCPTATECANDETY